MKMDKPSSTSFKEPSLRNPDTKKSDPRSLDPLSNVTRPLEVPIQVHQTPPPNSTIRTFNTLFTNSEKANQTLNSLSPEYTQALFSINQVISTEKIKNILEKIEIRVESKREPPPQGFLNYVITQHTGLIDKKCWQECIYFFYKFAGKYWEQHGIPLRDNMRVGHSSKMRTDCRDFPPIPLSK